MISVAGRWESDGGQLRVEAVVAQTPGLQHPLGRGQYTSGTQGEQADERAVRRKEVREEGSEAGTMEDVPC